MVNALEDGFLFLQGDVCDREHSLNISQVPRGQESLCCVNLQLFQVSLSTYDTQLTQANEAS